MSLDSRIRLARRKGTGARIHPHEVQDVCEGLRLLRACERAEQADDQAAAAAPNGDTTDDLPIR